MPAEAQFTDPLDCVKHDPGTALEVEQVCDGLLRTARDRHGDDVAVRLDDARRGGADDAYDVAMNPASYGLGEDEGWAWLWVAASRGHREARKKLQPIKAMAQIGGEEELQDFLSRDNERPAKRMSPAEAVAAVDFSGVEDEAQSDVEPDDGLVIFETIGDAKSKEGEALVRRYGSAMGRKLAWQGTMPAPGVVYDMIVQRWPWAETAARMIEARFAVLRASGGKHIKLTPLLFVGDPGSGKSSLAQTVCAITGLTTQLMPCGGMHDAGGLAAVTRGWATTRPSSIVQVMIDNKVCNPAIILDEIDKSSTIGAQNGSVMATLLSMVLSHQYHDSCLQAPIDISGVSFIATANDLERIDPALRDRFKIIRIPSPRLEDFDVLLKNVTREFARDNELDEDQVPRLDGRELEVLYKLFSGNRSARSFRLYYERLIEESIARRERAEQNRKHQIEQMKADLETAEIPTMLC